MHVLVLCDDKWHPAAVPRAGLAPLAEQGYTFDFVEDAAGWSSAQLAGYPLTILTKANNISSANHEPWMTGELADAFAEAVRGGKGLVVIHSGTVGYRDVPTLHRLIGGGFVEHPPQCDVTVQPADAHHPLNQGVQPFTQRDEHYMMQLDAAGAEVFLTTESEHGQQPGGWTRREGAGRVCVLTPGHNLAVWQHAAFQQLLQNSLQWCVVQIGLGH